MRAHSPDLIGNLAAVARQVGVAIVRSESACQGPVSCTASIEGAVTPLVLHSARQLFPRDAREAAWKIEQYLEGGTGLGVVVAEMVSDGAREWLRSKKIGYCDLGGSLFLPLPGAYILVDRPQAKREKRLVKAVLSGKTALVAHALWQSERPMKGIEIAEMTGLAAGTVSGALDRMDRYGWISTVEASGAAKSRVIVDRQAMLDVWRASLVSSGGPVRERFYVSGCKSPEEVAARIAKACEDGDVGYAFTGLFGAQRHAPHLSASPQVTVRVLPDDVKRLVDNIGARPVSEGSNLAVIASDLPLNGNFRARTDFGELAAPLVCWLDLHGEAGRSKEMADHLRNEKLS